MKLIITAFAGLTALASASFAQTLVEDTNEDGVYSMEELLAVYPALTDDIFAVVDTNEDGMIDPEELAAAQEAAVLAEG